MYAKMTYADVSRGLSERPCTGDFAEAARRLPGWKATAYGPREMADHGVKHSSIIWAWLRPEVLGAAAAAARATWAADAALQSARDAEAERAAQIDIIEAIIAEYVTVKID